VQHAASEPSGIDRLAMPWLRQSDLSFWWSMLDPMAVQVGLVVDKVALGKAFLPGLQDSLVNVIHTILHTHNSFIYHQCNYFSSWQLG
jgi:hypothetical protein